MNADAEGVEPKLILMLPLRLTLGCRKDQLHLIMYFHLMRIQNQNMALKVLKNVLKNLRVAQGLRISKEIMSRGLAFWGS